MPYYLLQAAYTSDAWAAQIKNPANRVEAVRPVVERVGGKIESAYLAFGDYDLVLICEFPDNVSAASLSLAASAGGSLKAVKTTPLMTIDEGIEAMKKAADSGYTPPGG